MKRVLYAPLRRDPTSGLPQHIAQIVLKSFGGAELSLLLLILINILYLQKHAAYQGFHVQFLDQNVVLHLVT